MKNPGMVLLCLAIAIVVFCGVFLLNPPSPRYYPVERVWRMPSGPAPGPAMGWYGRTGVAFGDSGIATGLAAIGLRYRNRRKRIELSSKTVYAIALLILACLVLTFAGVVHEQRAWFTKSPNVRSPGHEY